MFRLSDQACLLNDQYKDASNFNARFQLHERFSVNRHGWLSWVLDHICLSPESRILELGCGPGMLWLKNLHRIPAGWRVTLTDLSPGMVEEARKNLRDSGRPFQFGVADAQSVPFKDARFDAVIANHMLYHVPDRERAFSEIRRVLKRGGRLYASTVGKGHMREMNDLVKRFNPQWDLDLPSTSNSFLLETGAGQIARWLLGVSLHRYEDALVVTEAGPLIAYILSSGGMSAAIGNRVAEFTHFVEEEIAHRGAIRISKDSGLFGAYKTPAGRAETNTRAAHRKPEEPG